MPGVVVAVRTVCMCRLMFFVRHGCHHFVCRFVMMLVHVVALQTRSMRGADFIVYTP